MNGVPRPEQLRVADTALLVIDMQNDFVRRGAPREVPAARDTLPVIARLLTAVRSLAIPVVFTKFVAGPGPTLLWNFNPEIAEPINFCRPGHRRRYADAEADLDVTEIVAEIAPRPGDLVVEKFGYDAFFNSPLEDLLRSRGRDTVLVAGTVTQICVDSTARGAFHRQIRPIVLEDAVSTFDEQAAAASLLTISRSFGAVMTVDEALESLRADAEARSAPQPSMG